MAKTSTTSYCMGLTVTTDNSTTEMKYDLHQVNSLRFIYGESFVINMDDPNAIKELYDALDEMYTRLANTPQPPEEEEIPE